MAAKLGHPNLERDPRPSRSLLEEHREALPAQRFVWLPGLRAVLNARRELEEADQVVLHIEDRDEIALRAHGPPVHSRVRTKHLCTTAPEAEPSNKLGRMRERGAGTFEGRRAAAPSGSGRRAQEENEYPRWRPWIGFVVRGRHRRHHLSVELARVDRRHEHWNRVPARRLFPGAKHDCRTSWNTPKQLSLRRISVVVQRRVGGRSRADSRTVPMGWRTAPKKAPGPSLLVDMRSPADRPVRRPHRRVPQPSIRPC